MAVIINSVDQKFFTLNDRQYYKIYQPLTQGLENIAILNTYDSRQQILSSTHFSEFIVDGVVPTSQTDAIEKLLSLLFVSDELATYLKNTSDTFTGDLTINGSIKSNDRFAFYTESNSALGINTGSLLVSNNYTDQSKVPTNGLYSKGRVDSEGGFDAKKGSALSIYSSNDSTSFLMYATNASNKSLRKYQRNTASATLSRWKEGWYDGTSYHYIEASPSKGFYFTSNLTTSKNYGRSDFHKGYLMGGTNGKTNPIFCITESFAPNSTTLGSMYGIGYVDSGSCSFLSSSSVGTNPSGWGMYVAANGKSKIFLSGDNGRGYFKGAIYTSNLFLHSDRRKKKNIKDVADTPIKVRWRKFDTKKEWGNDKDRYGVVAQELQETAPEFVLSDDEGKLTVRYIDLLCAKMAEKDRQIQELQKMVKQLMKKKYGSSS